MKKISILIFFLGILTWVACSNTSNTKANATTNISENPTTKENLPAKELSEQFKKYWYAGEAEITSYELQQARYGEMRKGKAVLIYVTEDFLPQIQVKADRQSPDNIPVLKLNATKKFNTGIYPYSMMESTFYPVADNQHAIKLSSSMQEWCGHVYAQINNREQLEVMSHSYFQGEEDQAFKIDKNILENELWIKIRIDPKNLPQGTLKIIPSLSYSRLKHKDIKAYDAKAGLIEKNDLSIYTITYPELNRELSIVFQTAFPHEIQEWEETFDSGFGANAVKLKTKATKIKQIKSPYWSKKSNKDEVLREELGLQ